MNLGSQWVYPDVIPQQTYGTCGFLHSSSVPYLDPPGQMAQRGWRRAKKLPRATKAPLVELKPATSWDFLLDEIW